MEKQTPEVVTEKFNQAKSLIKQGIRISDACRQAGINPTSYYTRIKRDQKITTKAQKKRTPKLTIQALPDPVPTHPGKLMLVLGPPADLAKLMDYLK